MKIPLYKVSWDEGDVEAVTRVLRRGMYWTGGPENTEFEGMVAEYLDRRYGVAFNSGTSALTALLLAHGIGPGAEVIVPAFTYHSTADAVRSVPARVVFADIEEETYGLDVDDVKMRFTHKTKAVIAVHVYGLPCRIEELRDLVDRRGILLIEDAAEALGADVLGEKAGSFGYSAILSFAGNKVVTTGEGGMAVTDSPGVKRGLDEIRRRRSWRMSTIQAALGLSQFRRLDRLLGLRWRNASYLTNKLYQLHTLGKIRLPLTRARSRHTHQFYTIRVPEGRDELMRHLEGKGITTKVYFPALAGLPVAEKVASEVLTLPMYPGLTEEEVDYIAECIEEWTSEGEV